MAKIPVFFNVKPVDVDGNRTPEETLYQEQLWQMLQSNFSDNGVKLPGLSSSRIAQIAPQIGNNAFWIDTDTNDLVGQIGGVLYKFTKTPV